MTQDDIFKKIEEIYNTKNKEGKPTGRNFITHLLRAYFPVDKSKKIWDSPKKNLKCAITGHGLCTIVDALTALHSEGMDKKMIEHMKAWANGEVKENPMRTELQGKILGWSGKDTDTALCEEAIQGLFNWYATKILNGDKHINWVIKDMQRQQVFTEVRKKLPDVEDQKKIDRMEKISKKPQRATMSLGDLGILNELHDKLKQQEGK